MTPFINNLLEKRLYGNRIIRPYNSKRCKLHLHLQQIWTLEISSICNVMTEGIHTKDIQAIELGTFSLCVLYIEVNKTLSRVSNSYIIQKYLCQRQPTTSFLLEKKKEISLHTSSYVRFTPGGFPFKYTGNNVFYPLSTEPSITNLMTLW